MKKVIFAVVISLAVGFAAASWMETAIVGSGAPVAGQSDIAAFDSAAPVEARIRALEQAVIQEQQARQWLEEEIYLLREEIEQRDAEAVAVEEQNVEAITERRQSFMSRRFGGDSTQGQLDRLVQAGFPPDQAQWIVDREAEIQMERLQARYEAMQSSGEQGFFGRGFSQDGTLRAELGDADYERYLDANGRSTSVGIGNVLPNSPAQAAGIQPGDEIVRYDGERVFSMMDVAGRIMQTEAEGNVVVDIVRDGVPMQLVLPRGPLGVMGN
jgi:membrane-associated protease RseP (regulator of RpoE activity)